MGFKIQKVPDEFALNKSELLPLKEDFAASGASKFSHQKNTQVRSRKKMSKILRKKIGSVNILGKMMRWAPHCHLPNIMIKLMRQTEMQKNMAENKIQ